MLKKKRKKKSFAVSIYAASLYAENYVHGVCAHGFPSGGLAACLDQGPNAPFRADELGNFGEEALVWAVIRADGWAGGGRGRNLRGDKREVWGKDR